MRFVPAGFLLLVAMPALADSALASQAKAQQVLARAVSTLGGESALRAIRSVRRDYLEDWVDVGQGHQPWNGASPVDRLPPHSGFDDSEATSWLDYQGQRYYETIRYADAPNDYVRVVESGTPTRAFQSITYVRERPFHAARSRDEYDAERQRRYRRFPEGLLRAALERPETLVALGRVEEDGASRDVIAFADESGTLIRLYFDATTHLLARAETLRSHRIYGDTTSDTVFTDYRAVGALRLPFTVTTRVRGIPASRLAIRSVVLDAPLEAAWFEPPADPVEILPPPQSPTLETLGGSVYAIRGAYNLLFAEFSDHVLLVEAPMSEAYTAACLDLVAAAVPGKPIRLVATHFHFDHLAGLRTAVARGIPVLTTPDARAVIEGSVASRQVMRPDALGHAPRAVSSRGHGQADGARRRQPARRALRLWSHAARSPDTRRLRPAPKAAARR